MPILMAIAGSLIAITYVWSDDTPHRSTLAKWLSVAGIVLLLVVFCFIVAKSKDFHRLGILQFVFLGGWLLGATVMGGYLFLTHWIFGRHWNESFSSVRCKDWKNFVRFKIAKDGSLTIYPIGVPRVCRHWSASAPADEHFQPSTDKDLSALLIEKPIVIP
jgi:hypothetical protein